MGNISGVQDTFDTVSVKPIWAGSYGGVSNFAGRGQLPCAHIGGTPQYSGFETANIYVFDVAQCRLYPVEKNGATTTCWVAFAVRDTSAPGTSIHFRYDAINNKLRCENNVAYADATPTVLDYDPQKHAFLKLARGGGYISWHVSRDNKTWTQVRSIAEPAWTRKNSLTLLVEAARDGGTNNFAYVDDVNQFMSPDSTTPPSNPAPSLPSEAIPPDEVVDALLAGIVRVVRRVEIYESDGTTQWDDPYWNLRLVDGDITVDGFRDERRMIDLTLDNSDGALKLDPYDGFWYDKILKAFWGIRYFDSDGMEQIWETQIGEFMIDSLTEEYFPDIVKVTGRDYTKKCLLSKLKNSVQFPQYTSIETIIAALAANAGVTKIALPYTGQGYARDTVFERGTERWKVIKELADSIGYQVYFTGSGYLTMRPYGDPVMTPVSWIFRPGELDGTLVKYERSTNDSRIKNHVIVTGTSITTVEGITETIFAEAINNDTGSPTRVDRLGDRVDFYESEYITSTGQAQAIADTRLRISSLEEYVINFSSVIIPWLDGGDIVDIVDDTATEYVPKRFLLASFNFPLGLAPMTGVARRVTIVGTTEQLEYR